MPVALNCFILGWEWCRDKLHSRRLNTRQQAINAAIDEGAFAEHRAWKEDSNTVQCNRVEPSLAIISTGKHDCSDHCHGTIQQQVWPQKRRGNCRPTNQHRLIFVHAFVWTLRIGTAHNNAKVPSDVDSPWKGIAVMSMIMAFLSCDSSPITTERQRSAWHRQQEQQRASSKEIH